MKKWLLIPITAATLLLSAEALTPTAAHAAESAYVRLTFTNGGTLSVGSTGNAIIKNGVAYLPASTAEAAGITVTVDAPSKRVSFKGWEKSFAVRVGSRSGILDGKLVDIGGVPFVSNKQVYIPAKFLVKALDGGNVVWDAKKKTLLANGLHMFRSYSEKFEGAEYAVSLDSGELYVTTGQGAKHKIADLGQLLDVVDFDFQRTPGGLLRLQVRNVYGEPHINTAYDTFILKDGAVLRKAHIAVKSSFGSPAVWSDGKLIMSDGRTLRLIEDRTGRVLESYDLSKLMGDNASTDPALIYQVEAFDSDIALIRPYNTGLLTLLNRNTGEQTLLYKEFFDEELQQQTEELDPMTWGDFLTYTGRTGNKLTFTYNTGHEIITFTHTLQTSG
ncbi:hypothetical protein D3C81_242550 [compost metagenome]